MKEAESNYRKRAEFTNIILSVQKVNIRVAVLDIKFLVRNWHELSNYCHKQLRPEESFDSKNREFQENGFSLIDNILSTLTNWAQEGPNIGLIEPPRSVLKY